MSALAPTTLGDNTIGSRQQAQHHNNGIDRFRNIFPNKKNEIVSMLFTA
jgi:hypothetical protein